MIENSPKKILILSYGNAGSKWLAQTLHKLDNVFCTVGWDHPLESLQYWHNKNEHNKLLSLMEKGYFNKNGCKDHILAKRYGFHLPPRISDYWNIVLDETEELSQHFRPNCEYLINVHGLNVASYLISKHKNDKNILIYDLIRHPITTVETHIKNSIDAWHMDSNLRTDYVKRASQHVNTLAMFTREFKIDFSNPDTLLTFLGFQHIAGVAYSLQELNCSRLKFEDLKTNSDYFINFYQSLFRNKPTADYIDFVFSSENINSGRINAEENSKPPLEPEEQYALWSDEKKLLFKAIVKPELLKNYENHGYDFSFII